MDSDESPTGNWGLDDYKRLLYNGWVPVSPAEYTEFTLKNPANNQTATFVVGADGIVDVSSLDDLTPDGVVMDVDGFFWRRYRYKDFDRFLPCKVTGKPMAGVKKTYVAVRDIR